DTYDAVLDIVKSHCGAYGAGVEYAYTMVHGAPATKYPEYVVPAAAAAAAHKQQVGAGMPFTKTNKARGRTDVAEAFDSPEHSEACRDRLASAVGCLSA